MGDPARVDRVDEHRRRSRPHRRSTAGRRCRGTVAPTPRETLTRRLAPPRARPSARLVGSDARSAACASMGSPTTRRRSSTTSRATAGSTTRCSPSSSCTPPRPARTWAPRDRGRLLSASGHRPRGRRRRARRAARRRRRTRARVRPHEGARARPLRRRHRDAAPDGHAGTSRLRRFRRRTGGAHRAGRAARLGRRIRRAVPLTPLRRGRARRSGARRIGTHHDSARSAPPTMIAPSPAAHDADGRRAHLRSAHVRLPDERARLRAAVGFARERRLRPRRARRRGRRRRSSTRAPSATTRPASSTARSATSQSRQARKDGMQIAVGGCMAQMDKQAVLDKAPWVDVVFGTHNMGSLPSLLERARHNGEAELEILESLEIFPSHPSDQARLASTAAGSRSRSAATTPARSASCRACAARRRIVGPATS